MKMSDPNDWLENERGASCIISSDSYCKRKSNWFKIGGYATSFSGGAARSAIWFEVGVA